MARKYWDEKYNEWKIWIMNGGVPDSFPWSSEWKFPEDKQKNDKWKWGNCLHSARILPEPYWGNPINPCAVFININPGEVNDPSSPQALPPAHSHSYFDIAHKNALHLQNTENWHLKRFKWAEKLNTSIKANNCLSVELIPWHSKAASDVTKYIINNRAVIIANLKRFAQILPEKGLLKNTFIVRSAAFMDLLSQKDFSEYFDVKNMTHHMLARKGTIEKPISFLSIIQLKKEHGGTNFLIFHGGASNELPPLNYWVMDKNMTLKDFIQTKV